ncbi:ectoine hydroxylase-related dioxygenase (phytanoyl-CoA dioxygenase family) [Micromonospora sp. Llam0]|uniref:phytanoyl-CoA dioxygenase family protein n=1 Tax=Micromonospora sp. Llam0 TaxID=2485143 RepID=UPI000FAF7FC1|nr:phytanoyl-CoA dioxygenase family protein [Micromonospora sp. Llam0]ROO52678.1 ectoine hydroxylase-related dioxygenase (phytanoyl-CoA dioxygenase family) [Micromonospora sp. Llam0]
MSLSHETLEMHLAQFARDGYVTLPGVLDEAEATYLKGVIAEHTARLRQRSGADPDERALVLDFLSLDPRLVDLVDDPRIIPLVTGILGANTFLFHTHWCVAPSLANAVFPMRQHFLQTHNEGASTAATVSEPADYWRWHRDGGRINDELGSHPQPRLSLKVGVFLTDLDKPGMGNMALIPGSHLRSEPLPLNGTEPANSRQILARAGDIIVFDRRVVHSSSPNFSNHARMVLFYGYGYRWLRPRDDMTVSMYLEAASSVRRQLLGVTSSGYAFSSPTARDLPLADWMADHGYPVGPLDDCR